MLLTKSIHSQEDLNVNDPNKAKRLMYTEKPTTQANKDHLKYSN